MGLTKKRAAETLLVLTITAATFLVADLFFGRLLLGRFPHLNEELIHKQLRIADPVFDHTLTPNYDGIGVWGGKTYKVCTNAYGFKESCARSGLSVTAYDIAFIGDSITEGIGLTYEQTFVGQIAAALPERKIANLGVVSYSPSIYLVKVKKLLDDGLRFGELVVYMDISDIQDEAVAYAIKDGIVVRLNSDGTPASANRAKADTWDSIQRKAQWAFPLTHTCIQKCGSLFGKPAGPEPGRKPGYLDRDNERSAWTYNLESTGYGAAGAQAAIEKSLAVMDELYRLLERNHIKLSIGVYPWPGQLLYDKQDSLQVKIWKEFCVTRCSNFYNLFPAFFEQINQYGHTETINRFFIDGDLHHNFAGSALVARNFLQTSGL